MAIDPRSGHVVASTLDLTDEGLTRHDWLNITGKNGMLKNPWLLLRIISLVTHINNILGHLAT